MRHKLKEAVRANNYRAVLKCIGSGCDINFLDDSGNTPLMWAVYRGYTNIVKSLLKYGANPTQQCGPIASTPIDEAIFRGRRDLVQLMEEHIRENIPYNG